MVLRTGMAFRGRRRCGGLERRDVLREGADRLSLLRGQRCWLLCLESTMLLLQIPLRVELVLKLALERTGHEAILRLHGVVLTHGTIDVVLRSLKQCSRGGYGVLA